MNNYVIPFFVITCSFSQASYATHAYRSEDCVSTSHNFDYLGNYPYGGYYGLSVEGHEPKDPEEEKLVYALPLSQEEDADVLFDTANEKIVSQEPTVHDCWFDHDEWSSTKDVTIMKITEEASTKLGLKKGDVLSLSCEESTDIPNGDHCGED